MSSETGILFPPTSVLFPPITYITNKYYTLYKTKHNKTVYNKTVKTVNNKTIDYKIWYIYTIFINDLYKENDGIINEDELYKEIISLIDINYKCYELNFSFNEMINISSSIQLSRFKELRLVNFSNNKIREIPVGIFDECYDIEHIILSNNNITELQEDIFKNCSKIREIDISNNKLRRLPKNIFKNCMELENINIYGNNFDVNDVESIDENIFENNNKLMIFKGDEKILSDRVLMYVDNNIELITNYLYPNILEGILLIPVINMYDEKIEIINKYRRNERDAKSTGWYIRKYAIIGRDEYNPPNL